MTEIATNGDDPAHLGTLTVSNVQILAFDPVNDPTPQNGTIDVTGGTYVIIGEQTVPLTIEAGATAELDITANGASTSPENVMFGASTGTLGASTGTLVLDQPNDFTGTIAGIIQGDASQIIDLGGLGSHSGDTFSVTATYGNVVSGDTTLAVTDTTPGNGNSESVLLVGNESTANGFSWAASYDGGSGADVIDPTTVVAIATIAAGASLDIGTASSETVTFTGGTGSLVLADPEAFSGQIVGFTGTAPDAANSDTIDLVGINYDSTNFAETYNATTGLFTVTDGTNSASITFDDFNATLDFASDGNGGTLITDPPATNSSATTANAPVDWEMKFEDDKIDLDAGQATNRLDGARGPDGPKDLLVSLHNGNFVFHSELGAEAGDSLNQNIIANELHNHPDAQLAQQLTALVTPDPHHEWFNDLIHKDSLALPSGVTAVQWHDHLANAFHLH